MYRIFNTCLTTYAISLGDATLGDNRIVSFDPLNTGAGVSLVYDPSTATPSASAAGGIYNGLAADVVNRRLFFRASSGGGNGNGGLFTYDLNTGQQRQVTGAGLNGPSTNAAFFGNAYWYVVQSTDTLVRVSLDFSNPTIPAYTTTSYTDFDGDGSNTSLNFGDIVISSTGQLYGSANERFFTMSVANGSPSGYHTISSSSALGMQMVFNVDETVLYGALNVTSSGANRADIFQVTPGTGNQTQIGSFNNRRFADLTGVVRTGILASSPEPGTLPLALLPTLGALLSLTSARARFRYRTR